MRNLAIQSSPNNFNHLQNLQPAQGETRTKGAPIYIVKKEQADTNQKINNTKTADCVAKTANSVNEEKQNNAIPARGYQNNIESTNKNYEMEPNKSIKVSDEVENIFKWVRNIQLQKKNIQNSLSQGLKYKGNILTSLFYKKTNKTIKNNRLKLVAQLNAARESVHQSPISKRAAQLPKDLIVKGFVKNIIEISTADIKKWKTLELENLLEMRAIMSSLLLPKKINDDDFLSDNTAHVIRYINLLVEMDKVITVKLIKEEQAKLEA